MPQKTIFIRGMHCKSCEILLEDNFKKIPGLKSAKVSHHTGRADLVWENSEPSPESLENAVESAGYSLGKPEKNSWLSQNLSVYANIFFGGLILSGLYSLASFAGLFRLNLNPSGDGWWLSGLVGLTAGFSSCMALVGGLVLGISARYAELHPEKSILQKFRPHLFFNAGRVLGFAILGGLIGLAGSILSPSIFLTGILSLLVGLVMIFLGLKLLGISPILENISLTLPKNISHFFGSQKDSQDYSHRAALLSGALTFFLPCGFTQAMQVLAISSGSFVKGASIMSLFALGTAPGLLSVGGLSSAFKGRAGKIFFAVAGLLVIILGSYNLTNAGQIVFSPRISNQSRPLVESLNTSPTPSPSLVPQSAALGEAKPIAPSTGSVQEVRMTQDTNGYSPNQFTVKVGVPVRWVINSVNQYTCAAYINMPAYGVSQPLHAGENIIQFTPTQTGEIQFSCSMGMYRGKFLVVGNNQGSSAENSPIALGQADSYQKSVSKSLPSHSGMAGCPMMNLARGSNPFQ